MKKQDMTTLMSLLAQANLSELTEVIDKANERKDAVEDSERQTLIQQIEDQIAKRGIKGGVKGLFGLSNKAGRPSMAKYRNPANSLDTWAGKGRSPQWMLDHIARGGKKEDLLISAVPATPADAA